MVARWPASKTNSVGFAMGGWSKRPKVVDGFVVLYGLVRHARSIIHGLAMDESAQNSRNPVVSLAEIPALVSKLAALVRASGYSPDLIVYVESGARLPAAQLCSEFKIGGVAVRARRPGHGLKRRLAPLARYLPRAITNALRRLEERSGVHGRTTRVVEFLMEVDFLGRAILVVDDAADTGGTLRAVKAALLSRGADPARLRSAVLAATTPRGRAESDFYVTERNSVLPWSSDSAELPVAEALMAQCKITGP